MDRLPVGAKTAPQQPSFLDATEAVATRVSLAGHLEVPEMLARVEAAKSAAVTDEQVTAHLAGKAREKAEREAAERADRDRAAAERRADREQAAKRHASR